MRFFLLAIGMMSISGCASSPWDVGRAASESAPQLAGTPNFDWRLSGDRRVAPLQVFDDGRDVWLQFAPDQAVPAIFSGRGAGARAVAYRRHPPYVVVTGHRAGLVFQGGALKAYADRIVTDTGAAEAAAATSIALTRSAPGVPDHAAIAHRPLVAQDPHVAGRPVQSPGPAASVRTPDASVAARTRFRIGPEDVTLRGGLARWAGLAGWTFDPQHWAVDVDIPVAGTASFDGDFKDAVRALLAATELAERPIQPCFYSNKVLRVVPHARTCQPRSETGASV